MTRFFIYTNTISMPSFSNIFVKKQRGFGYRHCQANDPCTKYNNEYLFLFFSNITRTEEFTSVFQCSAVRPYYSLGVTHMNIILFTSHTDKLSDIGRAERVFRSFFQIRSRSISYKRYNINQ